MKSLGKLRNPIAAVHVRHHQRDRDACVVSVHSGHLTGSETRITLNGSSTLLRAKMGNGQAFKGKTCQVVKEKL